jgi:hypothetical protein
MRTTSSLLFLMIACATLTGVTSYATPSQQTSLENGRTKVSDHPQDAEHGASADGRRRQKDGSPSDRRRDNHQVSGKNHPPSPSTTVRDRARQVPKNRQHSLSGNALNLHQTASGKSVCAAKGGPPQSKTVNNAPPVREASAVRPSAPLLSNARHRGANPAVIGGSATSDRNTGAINGNRVHRKP